MILLFPANNCKLSICQYNSRKFGLIKSKGTDFFNIRKIQHICKLCAFKRAKTDFRYACRNRDAGIIRSGITECLIINHF